MKRKTVTSSEVKNRWNRQHYDRVAINVPIGAREELQALAEQRGMSVSAYVRALVLRDAREQGVQLPIMGGGELIAAWEQKRLDALNALLGDA